MCGLDVLLDRLERRDLRVHEIGALQLEAVDAGAASHVQFRQLIAPDHDRLEPRVVDNHQLGQVRAVDEHLVGNTGAVES